MDPATPTDLDLALGADLPEGPAWSAYQLLRSGSPVLDHPAPSGTGTIRDSALSDLRSYVDRSRAFDREVFPNATAEANRRRNQLTRDLFTKPLGEVLDPDQHAALESRAKLAPDPDSYRSRMVLKTFLGSLTGGKIDATRYDHAREIYARQLGLQADTSDKAVFSEIQRRYGEHETATRDLQSAADLIVGRTLVGDWNSQAVKDQVGELAAGVPERLRADWEGELFHHYRRARDLRRRTKPVADRLTRFITEDIERREEGATATAEGADTSMDPQYWEQAVDNLLSLDADERSAVAAQVSAALESLGDTDSTGTRAREATRRTATSLSRSAIYYGRELLARALTEAATGEPGTEPPRPFRERQDARALLSSLSGAPPLFQPSDNWLQKGVIGGSSQIPTFAAFFGGPITMGALGMSMGGQSYSSQRLESPDGDSTKQFIAATASGGAQLGIEYAMTATGLRLLRGRAPTIASLVTRAGIRSPLGRTAAALPLAVSGAAGVEYAEEVAQDATDRLFSDVAAELSGLDPSTDWTAFFAEWSPLSGSRKSQETLFAVVPFALIGSGAVSSYAHFRHGQWLQQSRTMLRAVGIPEAKIDAIQRAEPEEAATLTQEAFQEGLEKRTAEERAEALAVLEESAQLAEKAGFPVVTTETNGFTEETEHVFEVPGGARQTFETREEALEAWRTWAFEQEDDALDQLEAAAREDMIDFLTGEGTAAEDLTLRPMEGPAPTIPQAIRRNLISPEQAKARVQTFLLQGGQERDVPDLRVQARRSTESIMGGLFREVVTYFKGGTDAQAMVEDISEAVWTTGLRDGFLAGDDLAGMVREAENATGNRYLEPGYAFDEANQAPLIEALSKLSREYLLGNARNAEVPETMRQWLGMILGRAGASFDLATELSRSADFMRAVKEGRFDSKFEGMIADAVGLNLEERDRRLRQRYEDQLAAEAMEDFPEVFDAARGRLPHPETLRQNQHPLAGEVRRLWEGLVTPTRRRRKDGGTVSNTRVANAYFLPVGEMADFDDIRQALNEKGFSFDTPGDLINALDSSINYGARVYGTETIRGAEPSFALAPIGPGNRRINSAPSPVQLAETFPIDGASPAVTRKSFNARWREITATWPAVIETSEGPVSWSNATRAKLRYVKPGEPGNLHFVAAANLPSLLENSRLASVEEARSGRPEIAEIHRRYAWADFPDGHRRHVLLTVKRMSEAADPQQQDADQAYSAEVLRLDVLPEKKAADAVTLRPPSQEDQPAVASATDNLASFLAGIKPEHQVDDETFSISPGRSKPVSAKEFGDSLISRIGEDTLKVSQPRASDASKRQLLFDFAESVLGGDPEGGGAGQNPGRLGRLQVLRQALAADLTTDLRVRFIGETIDSRESLVKKAQALRNPRFETLYVLALDEKRKLLDAMAISARVPVAVQVFEDGKAFKEGMEDHAAFLQKAGAKSFVLLHNHPSGDPTPSRADIRFTTEYAQVMEAVGFEFRDHIVINHETFTAIDANGAATPGTILEGEAPSPDPLARATGFQLGATLDHPDKVGAAGKALDAAKKSPDLFTGFILDARLKVVATLQGTLKDFKDLTPEQLQDFARSQGGESLMVYGESPTKGEAYTLMRDLAEMTFDNRLMEAVVGYGTGSEAGYYSAIEEGFRRKVRFFGGEDALGVRIQDETFSISPKGLNRLEAAIAKKATAGPEERANLYERLRDRLASLTLRLSDMDAGIGTFARKPAGDPVLVEQRRIKDALAEAQVIVSALPVEAQGRVTVPVSEIMAAKTERGKVAAFVRMIDQADSALETVLRQQYRDAFGKLLDLAQPDLRQNRGLRGRLTPQTQRLVARILDVANLDPTVVGVRLHNADLKIRDIEDALAQPDADTEALTKEHEQAEADRHFLDTFGAFATLDAASMATAFRELQSIYARGRYSRQVLDEAQRKERTAWKADILQSLGSAEQPKWAKRTSEKGTRDLLQSFRFGLYSFHQVMEKLFPSSVAARNFQDRIRAADRQFTRAKIDARETFEDAMRRLFALPERGWRRKLNSILAKLSERRDFGSIELREGVTFEDVKLTPEQAEAIVAGKLKPGWQTDPIAMEALRQSLADFRMERLKERSQKKFVRFRRLKGRGAPAFFHASDLEALYILQLAGQEQYLPALDRYGFTAKVLDQIRAEIDPRATGIGMFLRAQYAAEYDRLNPVYQALYGMDMPRIRNYAPGLFENLDSGGQAELQPDSMAQTDVNAMSAGFTKTRSHHTARPRQANALTAYWSHLEATEYFIAYAELVRDMRAVFRAPDVRRAIEANFGTRIARDFSTWLDAIEVDGRFRAATAQGAGELLQNALIGQSAIGLAFNVGSLFKQASAATGFLMEMKPGAAIKGLVSAIRNPESLRTVWETESIQQRILQGMNPEDRRLLDAANAKPSRILELYSIGRLPIAYTDAAFTALSAAAAYRYHLDEARRVGMGQDSAEKFALEAMDRVVTRTAQPATTQDKSLAEITAKGFARTLFVFRSDPRQKAAISLQALSDAAGGRMEWTEAGRRVFWSWAIYGILAQLGTDAFLSLTRDDDDEERWNPKDYLAAAIAGPLAGIPLLGSGIEYLIRETVGTGGFTSSQNPIDQALASALTAIRSGTVLKTVAALQDESAELSDIAQAALSDARAWGQLAAAFKPEAGIIAVGARVLRDVAGTADRFHTSERERDEAIIREERKAAKLERDELGTQADALAKELEPLDQVARGYRLHQLPDDLRDRVESRLARGDLSPRERSLKSLPIAARAAAIRRMLASRSQREQDAMLDRLRAVRVLTPSVEAELTGTPAQ